LSQAQRIIPGQIEPYLALARAHLRMNDLSKAAVCAERAIDLAPDQINPLLIRAKIALAADDPRGALNRAQSALQLDPNDTTAIHTAAVSLGKLDRKNDALELLDKGIPLATQSIPLQVERVKLLEELKGKPTALAALQELATQYPEEAVILAPLSIALADCGQREAAIRTAQKAFQVDSSSKLELEQTASLHQLLGQLLQQSGQLDLAIHEYTETIRLLPNSLELYLELGNLYQTRRQQALAMQVYQKAITIAANDPRPYYQAGMALKESHDYKAAENMLRRAANLAREDVNIHRSLAAVVALNLVYKTQTESVSQSTIL
jgi:tetratricopeptide (TPR) repeat protein